MARFRIAVLAVATLVTLAGSTAHATTVRDGDNFSITIDSPGTLVCVIFPKSAREPAGCAGLRLPNEPSRPVRDVQILAIGLIRFGDASTPTKASLGVTLIPQFFATEPDRSLADAFASEIQKQTIRDHPGARVRSGTSHAEIRVIGSLKTVRLSYDLDGLSDHDRELTEHHVGYLIWTLNGMYAMTLQSAGEYAAAIDALADRSVLTVKVAQPPLPADINWRPVIAVVLWLIFGLVIAIDYLVVVFRRDRLAPAAPPLWAGLNTGAANIQPPEFDVSVPARLRQQIRPAAPALKIIGLTSAFAILMSFSGNWWLGLICFVAVAWAAYRIANRLQSGSTLSGVLASAWCVFAVGLAADGQVRSARASLGRINSFYDVLFSVIGMLIFVLPIYFLARGLLAFRALRRYQQEARATGNPLASHPWPKGLYIRRRPRFVNRRSIEARVFLLLAPVPYLWVWSWKRPPIDVTGDRAFVLGEITGETVGAIAFCLGALALGAYLYRRARRLAMVPGSELVKTDPRPTVLYLRSFHDDSGIKLRARATDGRILLERLPKISFEELITDHLWGYGPVLAIGNPLTHGKLAPLGAARDYVPDARWQETATSLMRQASIIVAMVGATKGIAWEMHTIVEQGLVSKLVLLLPPLGIERLKARWQFLLGSAIGTRLPSEPDLSRARAVVFPGGRSIVITGTKRNDWTYEAVLDAAVLAIENQGSTSVTLPLAAS